MHPSYLRRYRHHPKKTTTDTELDKLVITEIWAKSIENFQDKYTLEHY